MEDIDPDVALRAPLDDKIRHSADLHHAFAPAPYTPLLTLICQHDLSSMRK